MLSIMPYIWILIAISFMFLEATTTQMVSIWFAISALVTIIPAAFKLPLLFQFSVFVILALVLLLVTRPFTKKFLEVKKQKTNADRVLELDGTVMEEINNLKSTGRVDIDGLLWTARSTSNEIIIPVGTVVKPERIEGVKLIVNPVPVKEKI